MTSVFVADQQQQLANSLSILSFQDQDQDQVEVQSKVEIHEKPCGNQGGVCAICLDKIVLQETPLVKGCEHAYCHNLKFLAKLGRALWQLQLNINSIWQSLAGNDSWATFVCSLSSRSNGVWYFVQYLVPQTTENNNLE
ncbi:RING/U-box superfamily protein [Euphorbia peplus]|nr:RING/U-box superfamily protein [Euphorbia peplus]